MKDTALHSGNTVLERQDRDTFPHGAVSPGGKTDIKRIITKHDALKTLMPTTSPQQLAVLMIFNFLKEPLCKKTLLAKVTHQIIFILKQICLEKPGQCVTFTQLLSLNNCNYSHLFGKHIVNPFLQPK